MAYQHSEKLAKVQELLARTIDGVKLRTRAGMGRCQSGFCQPTVLDILRDEYGLRFDEVTKNGGKSYVITGGEK